MDKYFAFVNEGAKRDYLDLPEEMQKQFGLDLCAVQQNKKPFSIIKNLAKSIGPGVIELVENGSPAYRAVYCAKHLNTVFVLHAFTKTTDGVDRKQMSVVEQRYKEMMAQVTRAKKKSKI